MKGKPHETLLLPMPQRTPLRRSWICLEYRRLVDAVDEMTTVPRKRLCRDCADFAQDGICPNDGQPCATRGVVASEAPRRRAKSVKFKCQHDERTDGVSVTGQQTIPDHTLTPPK
jgi:hypothetical protein